MMTKKRLTEGKEACLNAMKIVEDWNRAVYVNLREFLRFYDTISEPGDYFATSLSKYLSFIGGDYKKKLMGEKDLNKIFKIIHDLQKEFENLMIECVDYTKEDEGLKDTMEIEVTEEDMPIIKKKEVVEEKEGEKKVEKTEKKKEETILTEEDKAFSKAVRDLRELHKQLSPEYYKHKLFESVPKEVEEKEEKKVEKIEEKKIKEKKEEKKEEKTIKEERREEKKIEDKTPKKTEERAPWEFEDLQFSHITVNIKDIWNKLKNTDKVKVIRLANANYYVRENRITKYPETGKYIVTHPAKSINEKEQYEVTLGDNPSCNCDIFMINNPDKKWCEHILASYVFEYNLTHEVPERTVPEQKIKEFSEAKRTTEEPTTTTVPTTTTPANKQYIPFETIIKEASEELERRRKE